MISAARKAGGIRPRGWFARVSPEARRGALFMRMVGLLYVATTYAVYLFGERKFGIWPVTLVFAAIVVLWRIMGWEREDVAGLRILAVPAFALTSFMAVHFTGVGLSVGFFCVSVANGVFLFGFRGGVAYSVAILALLFGDIWWAKPEMGVVQALEETAPWSGTFAFVLGMCTMAVEAVKKQMQTQDLLAELEEAHAELKRYAEQVRELAISEERNRMAREIHDAVGHYLTVVNVQLEAASKLLDRDPERAREAVARAKSSASAALSEARRSVRALKPVAVEGADGAGALAALAREFGGGGVAVSFDVSGKEIPLRPETKLILYRGLQEGLTNAVKHSGASKIQAELMFEGSEVRLVVADNGCGAPEGSFKDRGFGITGLGERVAAAGGSMKAENALEGGFRLEVELPVKTYG